ncbi:MAG: hypothetical protein PUC73_07680 [Lachnospiraceae bacterium]|nr:hypothetical protein [Lachnospiraceae bacterium]
MRINNYFADGYFKSTGTRLAYEVLCARGFLLEYVDSKIMISDNSHIKDARYLDEILRTYDIGRVCGDIVLIQDIDNTQRLLQLFEGGQQIRQEMCCYYYDWRYFSRRVHGFKVPTIDLEPYIARYIKAISSAGVLTYSCCDGNHGEKESYVRIGFSGYPSMMWHRFLWKEYYSKSFALDWDCNYTCIRVTEDNRKDIYRELNRVAADIYADREALRKVKQKSTRWINRRVIREYNEEEIGSKVIQVAKQ